MVYPFLSFFIYNLCQEKLEILNPMDFIATPESMRKDGCRLGENCHLPQKSEAWCWGRSQLQGIWFVLSLLPRQQKAWSSDLVIERELISVTAPVVYQCLSTLSTPFPGEFCHLCSREARKKKEKPKRSRPEAHDMAYHGIPWHRSMVKVSSKCPFWYKT